MLYANDDRRQEPVQTIVHDATGRVCRQQKSV